MQRFLGLGRLPLWRWRFFFRPFICAAPTQAIAVLLICILFGCGTFVPMPHCATDFAFPFYLFRFCCGVLSVVSIQAFLQQIPVMASTTAPFTCWPGHQVHLRASCRHHHVRSLDQRLETPFSCRRVYWDLGLPALFKR